MRPRDPGLYRKLSEPFESVDVLNALEAFQNELYELRVKYKIRDFSFQVGVSYLTEGGEENSAMVDNHYGSTAEGVTMLAYALGRAMEAQKDLERRALEQGRKAGAK